MKQTEPRQCAHVQVLNELLPLVDRVPVAELLKGLIDITDYRAILAADDLSGSSGRLWRNLDKLVGDAQTSGQVNVRDFLQYLATLSDAGAREGEAPVEAYGAVRLMTIHRSKGLEFPVVVLADAGRRTAPWRVTVPTCFRNMGCPSSSRTHPCCIVLHGGRISSRGRPKSNACFM